MDALSRGDTKKGRYLHLAILLFGSTPYGVTKTQRKYPHIAVVVKQKQSNWLNGYSLGASIQFERFSVSSLTYTFDEQYSQEIYLCVTQCFKKEKHF